jgi:ABC-type antimicrobial peptide transport system permease subunit
MALGATAGAVRRMVVAHGSKVVVAGVVVGIGAAIGATRLLNTLLFGVRALEPLPILAVSVVMLGIGMLASYLPARRASNLDPIESLRVD